MKKIILFVMICLVSISASAKMRTAQEAAQVARQFQTPAAQQTGITRAPSDIRLLHTIEQPTLEPAAYVFGYDANSGFVIISADDQARTILGYTESGTWNSDAMPENMRVWMEHYAEEIASLQGHSLPKEEADEWAVPFDGKSSAPQPNLMGSTITDALNLSANRSKKPAKMNEAIQPLLGEIMWNQTAPYNNNCPADPDNTTVRCYTGCVATAAAQVMRKWKHPASGTGSHTYYWSYGQQNLSASFAHSYDWNNMPEQYFINYYTPNYTVAQASAVALLMSDVGIAADMGYGGATAGGSGAYTEEMAVAMQQYFKYDKSMLCISPDYMGQVNFETYVTEELRKGRPLLLRGSKAAGGGHAFVCDGLNDNNLFHINWGWGGISNGYFALSALDPSQQGAGASFAPNGYSVDVKAVMNIFPDAGNPASAPQIGAKQIFSNKRNLHTGDDFTIIMRELANYGLFDWQGSVAMAIVNNSNQVVAQIGNTDSGLSLTILRYYSDNFTYSGTLPSLPDGTYYVAPLYSAGGSWYFVTTPMNLPLVVEGNNAYFDIEEAEPSFLYYTSTDGEIVNAQQAFNVPIISNTYTEGQGIIKFDGTVTDIGAYAFYNCTNLQSITIPTTVTTLGNYAMYGCTGLEAVTIPATVTDIGWYVFYDCTSLTDIVVESNNPNYVSADGVLFNKNKTYLYQYPAGNTRIVYTIPNTVTRIYNYAFAMNNNLASVTIPNSVKTISAGAFYYCSKLSSIDISRYVTSIGDYVFYACNSLNEINVNSDNSYYSSIDGVLLNKAQNQLLQYPIGNTRSDYSIPNTINSINAYAFCECTNLSSVTIPSTVTSIGDYAFCSCNSLNEINVNSDNSYYSSIDGVLLNKAQNKLLQYPLGKTQSTYTIPTSVTNIAGGAFYSSTNLSSVTIPSTVTAIGEEAFAYCENVASVKCLATAPPELGKNVFTGIPDHTSLYVPFASVSAYRAAEQWNAFSVKYDQTMQNILFLDQNADNDEYIAYAVENYTTPVTVTIQRGQFKGGMYNTVCFPFAMTAAQIQTAFGADCELQALTSSQIQGADLHIHFTAVTTMEAGKPYLIKPVADITVTDIADVEVTAAEPVDVVTDNATFKGLFGMSDSFTAGDKHVLFVTAGNTLNYPTNNGSIAGMRAYLYLTDNAVAKSPARCVMYTGKTTPTGISDINACPDTHYKTIEEGKVILHIQGEKYNLQGQKM